MLVIRSPEEVGRVPDTEIRALIAQRIAMLAEDEPYEPDTHGYFIVIQPGDTLAALSAEMRLPVLENRFTGKSFGDPAFSPCAEVIEEHTRFFDAVYVIGDSGFGINLFVPKEASGPGELLAMYAQFAIPAIREEHE